MLINQETSTFNQEITNKPLRIAVIAPPDVSVPPIGYGGTEAVVDDLTREFVDMGAIVTLFASGDSRPADGVKLIATRKRASRLEPDFQYAGARKSYMNSAMSYSAFELLRNYRQFDVVHNNGSADFLHSYKKICKVPRAVLPILTTVHGAFNDDMVIRDFKRVSNYPLLPISASHARETSQVLGSEVTDFVHHGLNLSKFRFDADTRKDDYCLFIGRYSHEKAPHLAIAGALEAGSKILVASKKPDQPCDQQYYETKVRPYFENFPDHVIELGEVSGQAKIDVIGRAKALIAPTWWNEPFGLTAIEGQALGTATIVCDNGASPELVEHNRTGFICNGEDEALAIKEIAQSILLSGEISPKDCRKHIEDNFSSRSMALGHYARLNKLVNAF